MKFGLYKKKSNGSNSINQLKIFSIKIGGSIFISKVVVLRGNARILEKLFKGIQNYLRGLQSNFFFNINEFDDNTVV